MKKKKLFFHSNFSLLKTGFGRYMKTLLSYLYSTGKYDLVNYCGGKLEGDSDLDKTPWKSLGSLPRDAQLLKQLEQTPMWGLYRYGDYLLDKTIIEEKPDVYIGVEDIWGFSLDKSWWNKIPCIIHTTLDSLPILQGAIDAAPKIKNYWVWSNFVEKPFEELRIKVKTVHGAIDDSTFYRLTDRERFNLRNMYNLPQDAFVVGFTFRNQLRKSVDKVLEGYKIFRNQNPQIKNTYLYFHTHWSEPQGWNIPKFINQYGINPEEALTTYSCKNCKEIDVRPFSGQDKDCRFCRTKGIAPNQEHPVGEGQITCNVGLGCTEEQLNKVYNLFSCYLHAFTSGGQEMPIQEAKFCELVTLVTNYSCGEEMCQDGAYSLPLEWFPYRELHGTDFIKAATNPNSIAKQLFKFYNMDERKKREWGQKARAWALENYSIKVLGPKFEEFIDSLPENSYDFKFDSKLKNPHATIVEVEDNITWLLSLYKNILEMDIDCTDSGLLYWQKQLNEGAKREDVINFFRKTAQDENSKNQKIDFSECLIKNKKKNLAIILPQSIGDLIGLTATFKSLRSRYSFSLWNFYMVTDPRYFEVFDGNTYIDKLLPYETFMDNNFQLEGAGAHKGFFDIVYCPFRRPQRTADYTHNGMDAVELELV